MNVTKNKPYCLFEKTVRLGFKNPDGGVVTQCF